MCNTIQTNAQGRRKDIYIKIMIIIISFLTDKVGSVAVVAKTFGLHTK